MILHLSGRDGPGITAALTQKLSNHGAVLIDLGQSVLHDLLNLSAIVDVPKNSSLIQELLVMAQGLHMKFEIIPFEAKHKKTAGNHGLCLTLIGKITAETLAQITNELAEKSINLGEIKTLSHNRLEGIELLCKAPDKDEKSFLALLDMLKVNLYKKAAELQCDLSIQRDSIFRKNRRLVIFDVDSTFIPFEIVDELGALVGKKQEIAHITHRAMNGELDFSQALKERVMLLKGLSLEKAKNALQNIKLNPGVERLVKILHLLGCRIGLVSGGFDFFVSDLRKQFNLDFAFANHLQTKEGVFTGEVDGPIVDAHRKAQILSDMCEAFQCQTEQTVAVGDGSNDVEMLKLAGLGIAYQAKAKAQQAADVRLNHSQLDDILYLMGIRSEEISELNL